MPVTTSATATMEPFDLAIASTSGDFWSDVVLGTATFNPIVLAPGATGIDQLPHHHARPHPGRQDRARATSTWMRSTRYDDYAVGEEIARLPYAYTIGK